MKVKAYKVTGTKLVKRDNVWIEEDFTVITCKPKEFKVDGVIVGELMCEPVKAEFDVSDAMLETAEITPYVARKRGKKEETNE